MSLFVCHIMLKEPTDYDEICFKCSCHLLLRYISPIVVYEGNDFSALTGIQAGVATSNS